MSEFIDKIKEEAKALSAAIDQELTVLEGVDGYDALRDEDGDSDGDTGGDSDDADEQESVEHTDDTEGGVAPV